VISWETSGFRYQKFVRDRHGERAYDGVYTLTDTGREIKGRELDLYLCNCDEADQFGRRTMSVAVIRQGWNPTALPGEAQRR
jgi:3D domain